MDRKCCFAPVCFFPYSTYHLCPSFPLHASSCRQSHSQWTPTSLRGVSVQLLGALASQLLQSEKSRRIQVEHEYSLPPKHCTIQNKAPIDHWMSLVTFNSVGNDVKMYDICIAEWIELWEHAFRNVVERKLVLGCLYTRSPFRQFFVKVVQFLIFVQCEHFKWTQNPQEPLNWTETISRGGLVWFALRQCEQKAPQGRLSLFPDHTLYRLLQHCFPLL
jgi:hypothetical protein